MGCHTRIPIQGVEPEKAGLVKDMFGRIAFVYDFLNHLLSFGLDYHWRDRLAGELEIEPSARILDLATGTGDQVISLIKRFPSSRIWALDFAVAMLVRASRKLSEMKDQLLLIQAPIERLPFDDEFFSVVTISFGLRNLADLNEGLAQIKRVLRKGGKLAILEFSIPHSRLIRGIYSFYLVHFLPAIGRLLSGERAYYYLRDSIMAFPSPCNLVFKIKQLGFRREKVYPLTFGIVHLYIFSKG